MSQTAAPPETKAESSGKYVYFDDFAIGDRISLGTRKIGKDEMIEFAKQFDPQPFHLDEQAGSESLFGGLSASGWHTVAIFMRMFVDKVLIRAKGLGAPGVDYIKWNYPVYPGDSISVTLEVLDTRTSKSKTNVGIVKFSCAAVNQNDVVVMEMEFPMLLERKKS